MNTQKQNPTNDKKQFRTFLLKQVPWRKWNMMGIAVILGSMQVLMHVSISFANTGTTVIGVESPTVKMPLNGTVSLPSTLNTTVATPWTPAQLANVSAWYDVSDPAAITVDAQGRVSQLFDKSGNNRHLVQPITTRQPQRVLNAANGKPVVRFDADDVLATTPFSGGALTRKMGKGYVGEKLGDLPDLDQYELLGSSVSVNAAGDRMAVGSWNRTPTSPNDSSMPGAVRLYQKTADGSWKLEAKICSGCSGGKNISVTTLEDTDQFGVHGVSLNAKGDLLAVGAPMDDGANNEHNNTGAVYLFAFDDDAFTNGKLQGILGKGYNGGKFSSLEALENFDQFGTSVALDALGTKLVVGARYDDGAMNVSSNSGAVYTFATNGALSYSLQGIIGAGYVGGKSLSIDQLQPHDQLGHAVSINADGGRLAIGAVGDDGYNMYDNAKGRGAVYLVGFSSGSTFGGAELKSIIGQGVSQETTRPRNVPISLDTNDQFGFSVSLNALGTRLAVGSPYEDAMNDTLTSTGKVRMFSFNPNTEFEGGTLESTIGANITGTNNINVALDGTNTNEDVVELPNNPLGDHFGTVAFNAAGNRLIVGAKGDDGANKITPNSGGMYEFSFPSDITFTASGGDQGEYVAVRVALSTEDQQKLDGYLAHKWGKVASLPVNHPFKLNPPLLGTTSSQQYPVVWTTSTVDTTRPGIYTVYGVLTLPQNVNNTLFNKPVFATVQVDTLTLSTVNPITGVRAPVAGEVPVNTVTSTNEYTGTVAWSPAVSSGRFLPNTTYTAVITLTPATGYTTTGILANSWKVDQASNDPRTLVSNPANSAVITVVYRPTTDAVGKTVSTAQPIKGVPVPVAGATPLTTVEETSEYTGTVSWSPQVPTTGAFAGKFDVNTKYTATISIAPKQGYTLQGVGPNAWAVQDASNVSGIVVSNQTNSGVVTVEYAPTKQEVVLTDLIVYGVKRPVTGEVPASTVVQTVAYDGKVTWSPAINGTFAANTVYMARIELSPRNGYSFAGVPANAWNVAYASNEPGVLVTNEAGSNTITVVYLPTAPTPIPIVTATPIQGVLPPTTGATPSMTVTETPQYTGTVTWSPMPGSTFAPNTSYTATVDLKPKPGYTLSGVGQNTLSVAFASGVTGVTVSNAPNSGLITITYPATKPSIVVSDLIISGVDAPVTGNAPKLSVVDTVAYSGTVTWEPAMATTGAYTNRFAPNTTYVATIRLTQKSGYSFDDVVADGWKVSGATGVAGVTVKNATKSGTITVQYNATAPGLLPVPTTAPIEGVAPPVRGGVPPSSVVATESYTGTVMWVPTVLNNQFEANKAYSAVIALTPKSGYTFEGVAQNTLKVANTEQLSGVRITNAANSGVVVVQYPATSSVDVKIDTSKPIEGLVAPATGATPKTTITETFAYTGTVVWEPNIPTSGAYANQFEPSKVYKATITITPKPGYTVNGIGANEWKVAQAMTGMNGVVTNPVNSGIITVQYSTPTDTNRVLIADDASPIQGVNVPKFNEVAPATITSTAAYSGTVSWSPAIPTSGMFAGRFEPGKLYTATITLVPQSGYTTVGIAQNALRVANAINVSGIVVSNATNSGTVTVQYPVTGPGFVVSAPSTSPITGVTAPVAGATPASNVNRTSMYSGTVSWSPALPTSGANAGRFDTNTSYMAIITLTPEYGYTFIGVPANTLNVAGATGVFGTTVFHGTDSGTIVVQYPQTGNNNTGGGGGGGGSGGGGSGGGGTPPSAPPSSTPGTPTPPGLTPLINNATTTPATGIAAAIENFNRALPSNRLFDDGSLVQFNNALAELRNATRNASTPDDLQKLVNAHTGMLDQIRANISPLAAPIALSNGLKNAKKLVDSARELLSRADPKTAEALFGKLSQSAGGIFAKTGYVNRDAKLLADATQDAANEVVAQAGRVPMKADVSGDRATASVTPEQAETVLAKGNDAIKAATRLQTKMMADGIDRKVDSVVVLDVDAPRTATTVTGTIPSGTLSSLARSGLDFLEWKTPLATLRVKPAVVDALYNSASLSFVIKQQPMTGGLKQSLSQAQQDAVANSASLFTVEATVTDRNGVQQRIDSFTAPIEIRIPYQFALGELPDRITVFELTNEGGANKILSKYDGLRQEVFFVTNVLRRYALVSVNVLFNDVASNYWGKDCIASMAAKGIIDGRPGGTFDPKGPVTRAEFTKMIVLAEGKRPRLNNRSFKDITSEKWYAPYVATGVENGYVQGYPNGSFQPFKLITRQEMATIIARVLSEQPPENTNQFLKFGDVRKISPFARDPIAITARAGLIEGRGKNMVYPKDGANRAEALTVICRLFQDRDLIK